MYQDLKRFQNMCKLQSYCILGEKPVDSLQLMIEASDNASGKGKLLDDEITGNAFVFILAG